MAVNPPLNPVLMVLEGNGSLQGRDRAGIFSATGSGALRYAPAPGARVNQICNPRCANNATGWSTIASATRARVVDPAFSWGTALEVTTGGVNSFDGVSTSTEFISVRNMPEAGSSVTQITMSFDIVSISGPLSFQADAHFRDADGANANTVGVTFPFTVSTPGVVERKSFTGTFNSTFWTKSFAGIAFVAGAVNATLPRVFRVSNIVLEYGSVANATYFEPTVWLTPRTGQIGTAHASPSVSRAVFWVEEATTNLFPNPSAEVDLTGAAVTAGLTLSRSTTAAYLGTASFQVDHDGVTTKRIVIETTGTLGYTGSVRTFIASVWARGAAAVYVDLAVTYTDATATTTSTVNYTLTGAWQRLVTPTVALDASKTVQRFTLSVRLNGNQAAGTFYVDAAQLEEKAYATSYCDGSLGTGYSWAGTAHASASSRAVAQVVLAAANHYTPNTGAILARGYRDAVTGGAPILQITPFSDPVYDGLQFRAGLGVPQAVAASWWIANASGFVQSGSSDMPAATWLKPYTDWSGTVVRSGIGVSALSTGARPSGAIGTGVGAIIYVGPFNGPTFGRIGPVITYDQPLSDARRALVNDAIDSNGATDLWTLFEEWEGIIQPVDLLALQSGQATAGVKAELAPVDLLPLQSGRATAGVTAEVEVLDMSMMGEELVATARRPFPYLVTWRSP